MFVTKDPRKLTDYTESSIETKTTTGPESVLRTTYLHGGNWNSFWDFDAQIESSIFTTKVPQNWVVFESLVWCLNWGDSYHSCFPDFQCETCNQKIETSLAYIT